MKLSVIIPAHNEEANIAEAVGEVEASLNGLPHELIVVNDHSGDRTRSIVEGLCAKSPDLRLLDNTYDKGFANALKFGFAHASNEAVVPVMGDLCDDLAMLKEMFGKIEEGYDVVCGSRYIKGGARIGGSKIKGFFSSFVGRSLYYLVGIPTRDVANAYKVYRKSVLDSIDIEAEGFEISMEITLKAFFAGYRITEIPTAWKERKKGKSTFKMHKVASKYFRLYLWAIMRRYFKRRADK